MLIPLWYLVKSWLKPLNSHVSWRLPFSNPSKSFFLISYLLILLYIYCWNLNLSSHHAIFFVISYLSSKCNHCIFSDLFVDIKLKQFLLASMHYDVCWVFYCFLVPHPLSLLCCSQAAECSGLRDCSIWQQTDWTSFRQYLYKLLLLQNTLWVQEVFIQYFYF